LCCSSCTKRHTSSSNSLTPCFLTLQRPLSRRTPALVSSLKLALRQVHNALRQDVNRLSIENSELEHQTTRLTEKADRVKIVEGNLQSMVGSQGSTVDSFVGMVQENTKVLESMEALLAAQVAQHLISTVVQTDHNLDFKLSDTEINELILRVGTMKGVEAVDEQELRRVLTRSNGIEGVYSIIQSMLDSKKKSMIQVSSRSLVF
jgi:hypothetical protein